MSTNSVTDGSAAPESQAQLVVALAIVIALLLIGVALIIAAVLRKDTSFAMGGVGTIIGALATALNAPTGIGKVLAAAKASPSAATLPASSQSPQSPAP